MYDLPKSQETLMQRPFELSSEELRDRLEEMVQVTISDLVSEFLLMPKSGGIKLVLPVQVESSNVLWDVLRA